MTKDKWFEYESGTGSRQFSFDSIEVDQINDNLFIIDIDGHGREQQSFSREEFEKFVEKCIWVRDGGK